MPKNVMPEKISNICVRWQDGSTCPFFAEFLLRFRYREDKACSTVGIAFNKHSKLELVYNSEFLDKLTPTEVEAVCVHEIMHVLHKFDDRLGTRFFDLFNVAQDACVNKIVNETIIGNRQLQIPKGGVDFAEIQKMGYKGEAISEPVYDFLEKKAEKIYIVSTGADGQQGEGDNTCPNCGGSGKADNDSDGNGQGEGDGKSGSKKGKSGQGDGKEQKECPVCGGSGKLHGKKILRTTDDHTQRKEKLTEIEKAIIEDVINNARTRSWGTMSGNMQSTITELIKTKRIPWQQKLAMIMSRYVHQSGNVYENTWSRRNRRSLPLPGIRKMSKKIVVTVDTSGSVSDYDIKMFFGQIEKIVKDFSQMTLIQWDTIVQGVELYKKGAWKKIKVKGRGGTDPQKLYDLLNRDYSDVSAVVNFTDSFFDWGFKYYGINTIWAVINNPNFKAPFGQTIIIDKPERSDRRV
jgi:predicted metal-dependent peptidase